MRRVAEVLGVGTMTLYGYVRSKDELLDAAVDAAVEAGPAVSPEGSWREQLTELVGSARRTIARHPALLQIRLRQPVLRPEALQFGEVGMGILQTAGFPPGEAAAAFRLLFTYAFGFAALSPEQSGETSREAARAALDSLPAARYPNLSSTREEFAAALAGDEPFAYGLERILDGLEARLSRAKRDAY